MSTKKNDPLARALHWHAIWQVFVCPASNPVHMLVRWRARSSGCMGGWARGARLPVGVAGGGREEEEEERRRRREGEGGRGGGREERFRPRSPPQANFEVVF